MLFDGPDQPSDVDLRTLLDGCQLASCSPVFRGEAIHPLPSWYFDVPWGDAPLYVMAASHGRIHYLPDIMGVYRIRGEGMYRGLARLLALELQTTYYARLQVPPAYEADRRRRLAETWVKLGLEHERLEDRAAARRCLGKSLRIHPVDVRRVGRGRAERRRLVLWTLLRTPHALAHHPRLAAWRRSRVEEAAPGPDQAPQAR
jgi:hypothetical protein